MGSVNNDASFFQDVAYIPPDPIFELTRLYNNDPDTQKVNLGQGTYKDEQGNPWILPSVKAAKEKIKDANHEYLPILGLASFRELGKKLIYGEDSQAIAENRVRILLGLLLSLSDHRKSGCCISSTIWHGVPPPCRGTIIPNIALENTSLHHKADMV